VNGNLHSRLQFDAKEPVVVANRVPQTLECSLKPRALIERKILEGLLRLIHLVTHEIKYSTELVRRP
jgi:hypothetical protein